MSFSFSMRFMIISPFLYIFARSAAFAWVWLIAFQAFYCIVKHFKRPLRMGFYFGGMHPERHAFVKLAEIGIIVNYVTCVVNAVPVLFQKQRVAVHLKLVGFMHFLASRCIPFRLVVERGVKVVVENKAFVQPAGHRIAVQICAQAFWQEFDELSRHLSLEERRYFAV